jgi:hypothetical protein
VIVLLRITLEAGRRMISEAKRSRNQSRTWKSRAHLIQPTLSIAIDANSEAGFDQQYEN